MAAKTFYISSSSILQLQHLRMLSFKDCYTEKWRNERQTMPRNMPAEGLEMSSALEYLDFGKCVVSESKLFSIFDYSSTLEVLSLSETDIVSLPASIKRFVRLRDLILWDCKQLQEIVELPENIRKEQFELLLGGICFPGNRIPDWFSHHHVWLEYSTLESFKLEGNNLRVKFYCDFDPVFFKSCGVYLVHKHEGSPTDDLALPPEAVDVHLDLLDEVIENSEDLGQSIQLSKRLCDDNDDCN
ncbi:hypothetical protein CJ030_MR0G006941 [Morella rubra]|uniref:TMV resistance protein N n=1 Tax=Morella rubra TaxID=262757 RepID=A0A6A1UL74_9ROSI|nr:hypothetical protein CJ030_MR0G006941 [Morella rubra]